MHITSYEKIFSPKTKIIILMTAFAGILSGFVSAKDTYEIFPAIFNLTNLNGKNGVTFNGMHEGDLSGCSVSGVGDINEDGIDDFLIGAPYVNGFRGQVYIVFGSMANLQTNQ